MQNLEELKGAISRLPEEERKRLARWMNSQWDDDWEQRVRSDLDEGKLDEILRTVDAEIDSGKLHRMP